MKTLDFCSKRLKLESDDTAELVYYITIDNVVGEDGRLVCENYGAGIRLKGGDEDLLRGITFDSAKIMTIIEILARNDVTPVTLRDVLSDILDDLI